MFNNASVNSTMINRVRLNGLAKRTEVLHGTKDVLDTQVRFFSNARGRIDTCMDYTVHLAIGIEHIKKAFLDAKSKGARLRCLTEITIDNISYCKMLRKIVDELRHLEGMKGNFMISESEYLAPAVLEEEEGKIASQLIYSNVDQIVEKHQCLILYGVRQYHLNRELERLTRAYKLK